MDKLKRIRLLLTLFVFISFFSCESKSELIVNNLLIQIENQKKKLDCIDLNQLELAFNAFHYNIKNINRCVDSFSLELGSALNYYKGIKKIKPGEYAVKHHAMELKISNQIIQLEWLRKDLKMDLLPVDSIPIYITLEERNINNISMDFKRHYYDYQYVINSHDSLDPYFKNIIAKSCNGAL